MNFKIFGIGNPLLCDDGIGVEVSKRITAPQGVSIYEGEIFVEDCLSQIESGDLVIIIDAVLFDMQPGEVIMLPFEECRKFYPQIVFCHDVSLLLSLLYGSIQVTGYLVGIQAAQIDYCEGLSAVLSYKLPEIMGKVNIILNELTKINHLLQAH